MQLAPSPSPATVRFAIISGPNNEFVSAYAIGSLGGLTLINTVNLTSVSSCSSTGCYVTGQDISEVKAGKASVVMGNGDSFRPLLRRVRARLPRPDFRIA